MYKEKIHNFKKQATHTDIDGNMYKFVNGVLFQYKEVVVNHGWMNRKYPVYSLVKNQEKVQLFTK